MHERIPADINIFYCVCVCVFVPVLLTQCNVSDRAPSIHSLIIDEYKERWDLSPVTVQLKHAREERLLYLWLYISTQHSFINLTWEQIHFDALTPFVSFWFWVEVYS